MVTETKETFVPLQTAAYRVGIPAAWLKQEAERGSIPHLKVGRRLMFNIPLVEQVLLERAEDETEAQDTKNGRRPRQGHTTAEKESVSES